jgi:hypothetical protein
MKHPCHILVEHELGAAGGAQLIEWASDVLASDDPLTDDLTIAELATLHPQVQSDLDLARSYFRSIIQSHFPEFSFQSPEGIRWAQETLKRRCEDYLKGRVTPYEFCRIVSPIEEHFDYPNWLGNLYNACDWVDEQTKPGTVPTLADEAKKIHAAALPSPAT